MPARINRYLALGAMLMLGPFAVPGADIMVGDWSFQTAGARLNIWWRDFEVIREDYFSGHLDKDRPSSWYNMTSTNSTSTETIRKENDGALTIVIAKTESGPGIEYRREVAIRKDGIRADYTFRVTGKTGSNQYNRLLLYIPAETLQPADRAYTLDGIRARKLPPLETLKGAQNLDYNVNALSWVCDGVRFSIDVPPPRVQAADGKENKAAATWSFMDYRKTFDQPVYALYFNITLHQGDTVSFSYAIRAEREQAEKMHSEIETAARPITL